MLGDAVVQPFALGEKATLLGPGHGCLHRRASVRRHDHRDGCRHRRCRRDGSGVRDHDRYDHGRAGRAAVQLSAERRARHLQDHGFQGELQQPDQPAVTLTNPPSVRQDFKLLSTIGTLGGLVTNSTDTTPVAGVTVTVTDATERRRELHDHRLGVHRPGRRPAQLPGLSREREPTRSRSPRARANRSPKRSRFWAASSTGWTSPARQAACRRCITFPAGLNFLSTPYDYSAVGFDNLFGNLNTAPSGTAANGNRSHVAVWDPLQSAYALDPNPPADALRLGVGYWVFLKNPVNLTQQGASPTQPFVPVTLHPFWNQIGVANPAGFRSPA